MNEISISLDISQAEILGVFKKNIHIKAYLYNHEEESSEMIECVIITKISEFNKLWKIWLAGKRNYCERYKYYCGVMGTIDAEEFTYYGTVDLLEWDEEKEDMVPITTKVYKVTKFGDRADFEHG